MYLQHFDESKASSLLDNDHWPTALFSLKRLVAGRGQVDTAAPPAQAKGHTVTRVLKAMQGPVGRRPLGAKQCPPSRRFSARPVQELQLFFFFFTYSEMSLFSFIIRKQIIPISIVYLCILVHYNSQRRSF